MHLDSPSNLAAIAVTMNLLKEDPLRTCCLCLLKLYATWSSIDTSIDRRGTLTVPLIVGLA